MLTHDFAARLWGRAPITSFADEVAKPLLGGEISHGDRHVDLISICANDVIEDQYPRGWGSSPAFL